MTPPGFILLDNRVFENFVLAYKPSAKAVQILETLLVRNN